MDFPSPSMGKRVGVRGKWQSICFTPHPIPLPSRGEGIFGTLAASLYWRRLKPAATFFISHFWRRMQNACRTLLGLRRISF